MSKSIEYTSGINHQHLALQAARAYCAASRVVAVSTDLKYSEGWYPGTINGSAYYFYCRLDDDNQTQLQVSITDESNMVRTRYGATVSMAVLSQNDIDNYKSCEELTKNSPTAIFQLAQIEQELKQVCEIVAID